MQRRVVVTGLGAVTPLGVGVKTFWSRLINGDCGVTSTKFLGDSRYFALPSQVAAVVPRASTQFPGDLFPPPTQEQTPESALWNPLDHLNKEDVRRMATFSQFAVAAASEALLDAQFDSSTATTEQRELCGVCLGSGIGSFEDVHDTALAFNAGGHKRTSPLFVPRLLINLAAGHVTMRHKFFGPNHAASTACTTGLHSIGDASRFILHGDADLMVAGGSESAIHPLSLSGFARAKSLSTEFNDDPQRASRPFDRDRCGFIIGEGAGVLILEELEHARKRGVKKIYAEVKGYGLSSDAHHITAPREDGRGAFLSMRRALKVAGIKPKKVDYVNAHATGTMIGDRVENIAVRDVLLGTEGKKYAEEINMSSIKGAIGHLLGAAGAVETLATVLSLYHGVLPPTLNLDNPGDPESVVKNREKGEEEEKLYGCNYVASKAQERDVKVALTNSFGFGGTNASLCLTRFDE